MLSTLSETRQQCGDCGHRGPHDCIIMESDGATANVTKCSGCGNRL